MTYRVPSSSVDITKENIETIKALFPEIMTDGDKIDFDMLRTVLGEEIDDNQERYNFTWQGKKDSILGAQKPSKGTLRPDIEASKNFDTTENLYIEGDNLEVLKLLQKSYNGKIKMIYIDPPYNTGNDFVYKDNFKDTIQNYLEQTGQVDEEGRKLTTNIESNGRFHTDWLNMIYPRLKLAKNLLTDDGVIFISIDHNEMASVRKIMDEIFGEGNLLSELVWDLGAGTQAGHFTRSHEYILAYTKDKSNLSNFSGGEGIIEDRANKKISIKNPSSQFEFPEGTKFDAEDGTEFKGEWGGTEKVRLIKGKMVAENGKLKESITLEAGWAMKNQMKSWFEGKDTFDTKGQKVVGFYINRNGIVRYQKERTVVNPSTILRGLGSTKIGSSIVSELLGELDIFDFPKPLSLLKFLLELVIKEDDLVLDFFSGSATTAHALMELNAERLGKSKFIMVQLPEGIDEKEEAYEKGYRFITEIGQKRINLAGEEIIKKYPEAEGNIDIGFKVLKLDKSNIREWNADFDNLEDTLETYSDVFVPGREELDIVYEIMLKNGLELTYPMNTFQVDGKNIYDIALGNLFICLDDDINQSIARAIIEKRDAHGIETSTVVFKDSGFNGKDSEKLNCFELLKDAGYHEEHLITI